MSIPEDQAAEGITGLLREHPALGLAVTRFMALHEAAQVLEELQSPGWAAMAKYLKGTGNQVAREAGLPPEFVQAMVSARPPLGNPFSDPRTGSVTDMTSKTENLPAQATCRDCAVPIGGYHSDGCDTARCLFTGMQRLSCDGDHSSRLLAGQFEVRGCGPDMWTGRPRGTAECDEYGWHTTLSPEALAHFEEFGLPDPGIMADLNKLGSFGGFSDWDQTARRWRKAPVREIDDTFYVQWHLDRGLPVPPGKYQISADGVRCPGGYYSAAAAAGRVPADEGRFWLSDPDDAAILLLTPDPAAVLLCGYALPGEDPGDGSGDMWIGRGNAALTWKA